MVKASLLVALLLSLAAPAVAGSPAKTVSNIRYGPQQDHVLDLCVPLLPGAAKPAVLLIHGGGWAHGDKATMHGWCALFAQNGIVAAAVGYRLAAPEDVSRHWPAQLDDITLAFQWMQNHAREFGADSRRICSYGESAGGHLSVWLAIKENNLACAIDGFGPVDLPLLAQKSKRSLDALLGQQHSPDAERSAAPIFSLSPQTAPILIIQGSQDDLVPPEQSVKLYEAAMQKGVNAKLITYPGRHSWEGLRAEIKANIVTEMVQFIKNTRPR
jgi:acetyl esterase/lipase